MHRAFAAATAVHIIGTNDPEGADALANWGVTALDGADGLQSTIGLTELAHAVDGTSRAALVIDALHQADTVGNVQLRDEALTELLAPALATGETTLVARVARRLVEADWTVLMEGLRRSMAVLVSTSGPGVVERLDEALRRAQHVLAGPDVAPPHLDAVATPAARTDPLEQAAEALRTASRVDLDLDALYLDSNELPPGLQVFQDSREEGPDPGDFAFAARDGVHSGSRVWMGDTADTIWQLVDIRFVFPDAERAAAYHAERLTANSEGSPPVGAPLVGEECKVFGGIHSAPESGVEMTAYFYVFRVANVVVKLFAAQGPGAEEPLTPEHLVPIARRIAGKLGA